MVQSRESTDSESLLILWQDLKSFMSFGSKVSTKPSDLKAARVNLWEGPVSLLKPLVLAQKGNFDKPMRLLKSVST